MTTHIAILQPFQSVCQVQLMKIESKKIPRVLLGTSPFIAAGQFGYRSYSYYEKFVVNPQNMVNLIAHVIRLGISGIQLIAYNSVSRAVNEAQTETGIDLAIVGTIPSKELNEGLQRLKELEAEIILLHGEVTDSLNFTLIEKWIRKIRSIGAIPGVAIHRTYPTLPRILEAKMDIPVIMLPVNKIGAFMQAKESTLATVEKAERFYIAKKPLAAGQLPPREGLEFVLSHKGISAVAVGVASIEEATETFNIAKQISQQEFTNTT